MGDRPGRPAQWPGYLVKRAGESPPRECSVVPGSTPVVSFGHPLVAEVATLGINPSSREFVGRDGSLLARSKRRLATLDSLGVRSYDEVDHEKAAQIVDDCADYFGRRPYLWFKVLDDVLSSSLGVSYRDGTACHLDLVQWATDPVWTGLPQTVRARLLSADRPFLVQQLGREGYRLIIVAGRTAMSWVQHAGLVRWTPFGELEGRPAATFYVGDTESPRFVGWSCNLQSQPGARQHMPRLIDLLGRRAGEFPRGGAPLQRGDFIPKGTHFRTRSGLVSYLEAWLERSDAPTIGDVSRFPRAPWISFESSVGLVDLNADTQRPAVERMIKHERSNPTAPWHVVPNRRGRVNKVLFDLDDSATGWYAYLRSPLSQRTVVREPEFTGVEGELDAGLP